MENPFALFGIVIAIIIAVNSFINGVTGYNIAKELAESLKNNSEG